MSTTFVSTASKMLALGRFARAVGIANGDPLAALGFGQGQSARWTGTPEAVTYLKSAVDAMTMRDPGGLADAVAGNLILPLIRDRTLVDRLPLRKVPLNVSVPTFSGDANARQVAENAPKPLGRFSTATIRVEPRKHVADVICTVDLLRFSSADAEAAIAQELARAVVAGMDRSFADPNVGGSISNGATSFVSSGSTVAAFDADFRLMLNALAANGDEALQAATWIMSSKAATYLASLRATTGGMYAYPGVTSKGGVLLGLPILATGAMTATGSPSESAILLLDPNQVLFGDENVARISVAKSASVQFSDTPTSGAAQTISLFQSDLVAIRAERWCGWGRIADSSVVVLDDIQFAA